MTTQDTTLPPPCGWNTLLKLFFEASATLIKEAQAAESNEHNYEHLIAAVQRVTDYGRQGLAAIAAQAQPDLESIERYRLQMAGISTAAFGYWKEGDGIHPDYDTLALRDVAKLYAKYDALYQAQQGKPGAFEVLDSGTPEYLDGVEAQFSVIKREGPGQWDYKSVCYCFTKEHAEKFCAALAQPEQAQQAQGVPRLNYVPLHEFAELHRVDYNKLCKAVLESVLAAAPQAEPQPPAAGDGDSHDFKNFHRLLCERFGYSHDEKDWRRDQLSLIEFIAAKVKAATVGSFLTREQAIAHCRKRRPDIEPTEQHIAATIDAYAALFGDLAATNTSATQGPMTQQEVVDSFCKMPHQVQFVSAFDAGVRFAEQYHGIGTKGGAPQAEPVQQVVGVTENPRAEFVLCELKSALNAMLTFFGMDEDDSNKEVFDKARQAFDYAQIVMRPLEPWERQSLDDFRSCVHRWHEKAVAKGFDGVEAMCDLAEPQPEREPIPRVLFDGFSVLQALDPKAKARTSSENVSDVLDAVVKIMLACACKCNGTGWVCENHESKPWGAGPGECKCGAGKPCPCNPDARVKWDAVIASSEQSAMSGIGTKGGE